ncbi:MAG TPA: hypothetical protein VGJ21_03800 [Terracidiphilus sp.]|jgi:RNA polymerase subunit RPABC4/transcription elongation factor Spt4
MVTSAARPQQTKPDVTASNIVLAQEAGVRRSDIASAPGAGTDATHKLVGYGLPCSKCHLYYTADLDACPICHHNERVSPLVPKVSLNVAQPQVDAVPDTAVVEQERDEFLRQFKSQLLEAHAEVVSGPEAFCTLGEHHTDAPASAEVCKGCYELLQERLDICQAALHMDLKEGAQIIYDAVWADPSDPNKTYQNAAAAMLGELRKRAGVTAVLGPFQPLSD